MRNKNTCTLCIATIILIILRCLLNTNDQLLYVVAGICLIGFIYVLVVIWHNAYKRVLNLLEDNNYPKEVVRNEQEKIRNFSVGFFFLPIVAFTLAYMIFLCSNLGNDILSIVSLFLSLCDEDITTSIVSFYNKEG